MISLFGVAATPVLLVRGIDCRDQYLRPIEQELRAHGIDQIAYASYAPRHGQVGIDVIAEQVQHAAEKLKRETGANQIDVVGFSMGALASRYFIQKLNGKKYVRKFISISGPHNGTYSGYLRLIHKGVRDMLPNSTVITELNADPDPFGDVQVYSYYTPYDVIILPANSSILKDSVEVKAFQVALHHQMVKDKDVLREISKTLKQGASHAVCEQQHPQVSAFGG